jgi:RES domain
VILYRCFAWSDTPRPADPDGPLWFPRPFQGEGRHDNPDLYGCLYLADRALSAIVEQLARFRTQRLSPALLRRRGLPLALGELELADESPLIDLDDPITLRRERLRPSRVATRRRDVTQPQARAIYQAHANALGLRWWSTYESLWMHVTLFDRATRRLKLQSVRALDVDDAVVREAADWLALPGRRA